MIGSRGHRRGADLRPGPRPGFAPLAIFFDHPHFTLVLADLSQLTLARLDRCFDEPIPNLGGLRSGSLEPH